MAKRRKNGKKTRGEPFGGHQAEPFGKKDDDEKEKPERAEKRKGKGKGRSPAMGVTGHETMPLPPHREPDGAPVEQFEDDAHLQDGDEHEEMAAAMRHKASGLDPRLAQLHDLTCPAFSPASVSKALPHATLSSVIDTGWWQRKSLEAATGGDLQTVMAQYNQAQRLSQAAVTLKTASPQVMHDVLTARHAAFLDANRDLIKTFHDATPGPGSFPTPGAVHPGQFRRPYISAGHGAESPQASGMNSFHVPEGQAAAEQFTRGYLHEGHAADSPDNMEHRSEPVPEGSPGRPMSVHYAGMQAADYDQAASTMHDHLSRIAPGMCPMSPDMGHTQKPAPPVPAGVGAPEPHSAKAGKSRADKAADRASAKARKAAKVARVAKRKAAEQRRKVESAVLKGKLSVDQGRVKLGLAPFEQPEFNLAAAIPGAATVKAAAADSATPDVAEAVKAALAPVLKAQRQQARVIRKQRKVLDAIAGQPDTRGAPFRGAGTAPIQKTSATVAPPRTVTEAAELAQVTELYRLREAMNSHDPAEREAARREMHNKLGTTPMTQTPDTTLNRPYRN